MFNDRNLEQLEKRHQELLTKERDLNTNLRTLREERKQALLRIERDYDGREDRVQNDSDRIVRELANLSRDIERRRIELQKEYDASLKK